MAFGGFKASPAGRHLTYDLEGKLSNDNISRGSTGGIGSHNGLYNTDAEDPRAVAPFLSINIAKDRPRRNYYINERGIAVPVEQEQSIQPEPIFPDDHRVFGHAGPGDDDE